MWCRLTFNFCDTYVNCFRDFVTNVVLDSQNNHFGLTNSIINWCPLNVTYCRLNLIGESCNIMISRFFIFRCEFTNYNYFILGVCESRRVTPYHYFSIFTDSIRKNYAEGHFYTYQYHFKSLSSIDTLFSYFT